MYFFNYLLQIQHDYLCLFEIMIIFINLKYYFNFDSFHYI
jgi:hypothetical protein